MTARESAGSTRGETIADAIVVAAGASSRMAGLDKVSVLVGGRPLIAHTLNALRGYEVGRAAKARGAHVVYGGIHATLYPDEMFEHGAATEAAPETSSLGAGCRRRL